MDIRRHVSEESWKVAFAQVIEDLCDLVLGGICGRGYALIGTVVLFWRCSCEGGCDCGSDWEDLEGRIHCYGC